MFAKLWKRTSVVDAISDFQFSIERNNGAPIRFNGVLQVTSSGQEQPGYRQGDPWHNLQVYRTASTEFAVVIEFYVGIAVVAVDAGIVGSPADVDDFFCMHAGEHFHRMFLDASASDEGDSAGEQICDKQLEQRVLKNYDRQILDVLNQLLLIPEKPENEA